MPILLRTQVDRTDKTPIPARRARVGGLCGFRSTAGRVPTGSLKIGRCASVRELWRKWQARSQHQMERATSPRTSKREKSRDFERCGEKAARTQDKAAGSCAPRGGHIYPRCGQFRGFTRAFQTQRKTAGGRCGMKKARRFKGNRGVPTKNTR